MYLLFHLKVFLKVYFSILFLILLYIISFQCEKCNYLALIGGGCSDQFTASENFAPPPSPPPPRPPNILEPPPPSPSQRKVCPPLQYSKPCPPIFKSFLCLWKKDVGRSLFIFRRLRIKLEISLIKVQSEKKKLSLLVYFCTLVRNLCVRNLMHIQQHCTYCLMGKPIKRRQSQ